MPRFERVWSDVSVLDAARVRVGQMFDMFDHVVVSFSGGKDSLACLLLVREVMQSRGLSGPVFVHHRDMEFWPQELADGVLDWAAKPWVEMRYCAFTEPMSFKVPPDRECSAVRWGPGREWIRPMPDIAVRNEGLVLGPDSAGPDDKDLDVAEWVGAGSVGLVVGMRAAESLSRFRAVMQRSFLNWVSPSKLSSAVKLCKPIYDWGELDVLKYVQDQGEPVSAVYAAQAWSNFPLRTSSLLCDPMLPQAPWLHAQYPAYFDKLMEIFPEYRLSCEYWSDYRASVKSHIPDSLDFAKGEQFLCKQYVDDPLLGKRLERFRRAKGYAEQNPYAYPPSYVVRACIHMNKSTEVMAADRDTQTRYKDEVDAMLSLHGGVG